jgi:hypothetical protein
MEVNFVLHSDPKNYKIMCKFKCVHGRLYTTLIYTKQGSGHRDLDTIFQSLIT